MSTPTSRVTATPARRTPEDMVEDFDLHMPDDMDIRRCYRHPDRETGVSCSNCGKPICYECMTPAPVGFRCPDCMAEQRGGLRAIPGGRAVPGARTGTQQRPRVITRQQTRARWQSGGLLGTSGNPVTRVLVGMNIAVFILEIATSGGGSGLMSGLGGPPLPVGRPVSAVPSRSTTSTGACSPPCSCMPTCSTSCSTCGRSTSPARISRSSPAGRNTCSSTSSQDFAGNILAYAIGPKECRSWVPRRPSSDCLRPVHLQRPQPPHGGRHGPAQHGLRDPHQPVHHVHHVQHLVARSHRRTAGWLRGHGGPGAGRAARTSATVSSFRTARPSWR